MGMFFRLFVSLLVVASVGCSYRYYAGELQPLSESQQGENREVADDGTVTYKQARLSISLRPMSDEEVNRQFNA